MSSLGHLMYPAIEWAKIAMCNLQAEGGRFVRVHDVGH